jgi:hypothetical protein
MNKGSLLVITGILGFSLLFMARCSNESKVKGSAVSKADTTVNKYTGQEGVFEWQFPNEDAEKAWKRYSYSEERWWGSFPKGLKAAENMDKEYPWALGSFTKYKGNPVLAPTPGAWDDVRCMLNPQLKLGVTIFFTPRGFFKFSLGQTVIRHLAPIGASCL